MAAGEGMFFRVFRNDRLEIVFFIRTFFSRQGSENGDKNEAGQGNDKGYYTTEKTVMVINKKAYI